MTLFSRLFKDTLALMIAVAVTVLLVTGLENNGENLFSAMLAFACMVPVIASAAIDRIFDRANVTIFKGKSYRGEGKKEVKMLKSKK